MTSLALNSEQPAPPRHATHAITVKGERHFLDTDEGHFVWCFPATPPVCQCGEEFDSPPSVSAHWHDDHRVECPGCLGEYVIEQVTR
jgi:hypothetical protein